MADKGNPVHVLQVKLCKNKSLTDTRLLVVSLIYFRTAQYPFVMRTIRQRGSLISRVCVRQRDAGDRELRLFDVSNYDMPARSGNEPVRSVGRSRLNSA